MAKAEGMPEAAGAAKTPVWFWIVAGLAALFNLGGVLNYLTTQFNPEAATAQMTPEQAAYFLDFPAWYTANYALTTHLAFIGAILLLFRLRWAFGAFAISAVLYGVSLVYHYGLNDVVASLPVGMHVFSAVIGVQLLVLAGFARWAGSKGWLR